MYLAHILSEEKEIKSKQQKSTKLQFLESPKKLDLIYFVFVLTPCLKSFLNKNVEKVTTKSSFYSVVALAFLDVKCSLPHVFHVIIYKNYFNTFCYNQTFFGMNPLRVNPFIQIVQQYSTLNRKVILFKFFFYKRKCYIVLLELT